jgi:hypothetical protein
MYLFIYPRTRLFNYLFAPLIISSYRATGGEAIQKLTGMSRTQERHSQATDITSELCIDKQLSVSETNITVGAAKTDKVTKTSVASVYPFNLFLRQTESAFNSYIQFFSQKVSILFWCNKQLFR